MIHLINSAVIPSGFYGSWTYDKATIHDLDHLVHGDFGEWKSYIGYPQTAEMISKWLKGAPIPMNRENYSPKPGDAAFVVRLNLRVSNPATKGQPVSEDPSDWELAWLTYFGDDEE